MGKMKKCKTCGAEIAANAKTCPSCGAKVKKHTARNVIIVLVVLCCIGALTSNKDEKGSKEQEQAKNDRTQQTQQDHQPGESVGHGTEVVVDTTLDTADYLSFSADTLYEYGSYLEGQRVVTAFQIADISSGILKAETENNDSLFFSVNCYFDNKEITNGFEEGDAVTIAGIVGEPSPVGSTVTLNECTVIGLGEIINELNSNAEAQREIGEQLKAEHEAMEAEAEAEKRSSYISQCETISYSAVERNPDDYNGIKIKVSGKVIQVSEGWLDSITLRLDCSGNIWYVTYTRVDGESRILEDDWITCYGECTGVTSYTTVLGSQVTIPSMEMVYYD